jgi:bile acid:Na+ symporter, BASS family
MRELILIILQVSIMCTVFGFGLAASAADLLYLAHRPALLARSLLAVFVIMPIFTLGLVRLLAFPLTTEAVLLALSMSAVPPLLPMKQDKAGGNASYGLGLMVVLSFAAIAAIPAVVAIMERFFERPIVVAPAAIAAVVMKSTLAPLAAGLAIRAIWPAIASWLQKPVGVVSNVLLPLAVVALVAGGFSEIWAAVGNGTVLAIVIFTVAGLAIGHVLGGPDPDQSAVLALSTACRHPAMALAIATTAIPDQKFGATILLYLLVNIVAGLPYIAWQRRRTAASSGA